MPIMWFRWWLYNFFSEVHREQQILNFCCIWIHPVKWLKQSNEAKWYYWHSTQLVVGIIKRFVVDYMKIWTVGKKLAVLESISTENMLPVKLHENAKISVIWLCIVIDWEFFSILYRSLLIQTVFGSASFFLKTNKRDGNISY